MKADSKDATETGDITKGGGVVDMSTTDEPNESSGNRDDQQADNTNTLEVVIKSKGLCGVFDHDFVENSSAKKPISVLEMEENAKKVAMKAALALKESSENQDRFEPTWTGSNETNQPIHQRNMDADASFGGANSAGFSTTGARKMASSGSLLVNLQNKRMQIASSNQTPRSGNEPNSRAKKDSGLLARLRKYISRKSSNGGPTTRDLLNEFSDVPDCDADMFRNTLKAAAVIKNGRWIMKEG